MHKTLEQRVIDALRDTSSNSSWERLIAVFRNDREAFYRLTCESASSADAAMRELVDLAHAVRTAVRESYEIVPGEDGASLVSFSGKRTSIPRELVSQVSQFLREIDGKTTSETAGKDYEGTSISEAEARFKLGALADWEAERAKLAARRESKPFVLRLDGEDLEHLTMQPAYATYNLIHCARAVILAPTSVFQGLRRGEGGAENVSRGWAICGRPRQAYRNDGTAHSAPEGMVHIVYADRDGYVFDWDWMHADPDRPDYPLGPISDRFEREVDDPPEFVLNLSAGLVPGRFDRTQACYSSRGDCVFCYLTDEESFAVRINPDLTVFQSFATRQHTGFKVKNVRRIQEIDQHIVVSDPPGLEVSVTSVLLQTLRRQPGASIEMYELLIDALYRDLGGPPKVRVLPEPRKLAGT